MLSDMDYHMTNSRNTHGQFSAIQSFVIAVLVAAAVYCLSLLAPVLWTTFLESTSKPTLASCASIQPERERLACYDQVASQAQSRPAKGGVPVLHEPDRIRP